MAVLVHLTDAAWLRGFRQLARGSGTSVNTFLGIPYATPPIGELRFSLTKPADLWTGERDATKLGPFCPQDLQATRATYFPFPLADNMSEDCLYMNVWTPRCDVTARLPVMVWIYGGGFVQGCSDYFDGTAYAAHQNVVFVSFNFRIGAFGFMSAGDDRIRGNMALFDILEALRWVQRHIAQFGGDPSNVTLFGESAGAMSISALLTSPLIVDPAPSGEGPARRLFHRAILQSGSCFRHDSVWWPETARKFILMRIRAMGGGSDVQTGKDIVEFLASKSSAQIVAAIPEGVTLGVDGECLTEIPVVAYKAGRFAHVDLMLGFNTDEGAYFVRQFLKQHPDLSQEVASNFLRTLVFKRYYRLSAHKQAIYNILHKEYLEGVEDSDTLQRRVSELYGDILFTSNIIDNALVHSSVAKTYLYQLDHRPSFSRYPPGVTADHGNDVPFVMGEPFLKRQPDVWGEEERGLSREMMTYWANFARTGDPNGASVPHWPLYLPDTQQYLTIRCPSVIRSNYESRRMKIWSEQIYPLSVVGPTSTTTTTTTITPITDGPSTNSKL